MRVGPDHAGYVAREVRRYARMEPAGPKREIMFQCADIIEALIKQAFLQIPIPSFLRRKR